MTDTPLTLSPRKRALKLVHNFEYHLTSGAKLSPESYFTYMDLCDLIRAVERGDATPAMLEKKVNELEASS